MIPRLRHATVILAACSILVSGCSGSSDTESSPRSRTDSSVTNSASTEASRGAESEATAACVPPPDGDELEDQDMSDHQVPWERKGADKVAIHIESGNVTEDYIGYLDQGAAAWNRSPCLGVRIVDTCPEGTNCVTVSLTPGDDADGNFDSVEEGDFTVGGHIDLFYEELDQLGEGAKLNVTIHEMGHTVGLRHRQTEGVLMNPDTYTDIFDPDETDFHNLRVLYGNQD